MVLLVYSFFSLPKIGFNDGSRWNTVWSLVHDRTYAINNAPNPTIDVVYKSEGGFRDLYSTKPALYPTLIAGVYQVLVWLGIDWQNDRPTVIRTVLVIFNLLPFACFLHLYFCYLNETAKTRFIWLFCAVAAAFGTFLTGYIWTLNNHILSAFSSFWALYLAWNLKPNFPNPGRIIFFMFLSAAFATCMELTAGLTLIFLFLWVITRVNYRKIMAPMLIGISIPTLGMCITEYLAKGTILVRPLRAMLKIRTAHLRLPDIWLNPPPGLETPREPRLLYFFNMLFGHHGWFLLTPIVFISLFVIFVVFSKGKKEILPHPAFLKALLMISLVTMLFVGLRTKDYGGLCVGMRWLFWLIPMWLMMLPYGLIYFSKTKFRIVVSVCLLIVSILTVLDTLPQPWKNSWVHRTYNEGVRYLASK